MCDGISLGCFRDYSGRACLLTDHIDLNGTLPIELIGLSSSLEVLSVTFSINLHGTIPNEYGTYLSKLSLFQLLDTSNSGTIPPTFEKLRKLKDFQISWTYMTGTIPSNMLSQLTSLDKFSTRNSYFTGTIPEFVSTIGGDTNPGSSRDVTYFDLSNSIIEGTIPTSLYALDTLKHLDLTNNVNMQGTISKGIFKLSSLQYL